MKKKVAFLGAGSFSDGVLAWLDTNKYEFVGYFDDKDIEYYRNHKVFGKISQVLSHLENGTIDGVFVTIGDNAKRREIFELVAKNHYEKIINIISPRAYISNLDSIQGRGIFIGFSAFIGADAKISDNCIINTAAIVEHHTRVEKHCNIAPRATVNGICNIGQEVYLGSASTVIQMISIADKTTVGAGAVVVKNIEEAGTYVGVPAKKIK
ncbi:MAG: acetyltransferase [Gemella sp.]|nr:acetyltransferase [Gemella sp.]